MKIKRYILLFVLCIIFLALNKSSAETVKTAEELIEQAHKHDGSYITGENVNRQKALSLYQSALGIEPDEKQRLHILYRMAQLYGVTYRKDKGEKPDYLRAMELYKEIIDSYPPDEPKVIEAILWIGGHQTILREFDDAIATFKKALEIDTDEMKEHLEHLQEDGQQEKAASLKKILDSIRHYQEIAVDHVDYAASRISYLYAHGELKAIIEKYQGTFIADRAHDRLVENMNKLPSLWAPQNDSPSSPSNPSLRATTSTPSAHNQTFKGIQVQSETVSEVPKRQSSSEPNTFEKPRKKEHVTKESRAPPKGYLLKFTIVAAGLIVLVLAVIIIRKRITFC